MVCHYGSDFSADIYQHPDRHLPFTLDLDKRLSRRPAAAWRPDLTHAESRDTWRAGRTSCLAMPASTERLNKAHTMRTRGQELHQRALTPTSASARLRRVLLRLQLHLVLSHDYQCSPMTNLARNPASSLLFPWISGKPNASLDGDFTVQST